MPAGEPLSDNYIEYNSRSIGEKNMEHGLVEMRNGIYCFYEAQFNMIILRLA
jgi:hypothetical protein